MKPQKAPNSNSDLEKEEERNALIMTQISFGLAGDFVFKSLPGRILGHKGLLNFSTHSQNKRGGALVDVLLDISDLGF